jgi:hypothetical protein
MEKAMQKQSRFQYFGDIAAKTAAHCENEILGMAGFARLASDTRLASDK